MHIKQQSHINKEDIQELVEQSGCSYLACTNALTAVNGNHVLALKILQRDSRGLHEID